jgi:hypothetical protein
MSYVILLSSYRKFSITILSRIIIEKSVNGEISSGRLILHGLWAHLTSISHLTSKPTHNASHHPARWQRWEDARAVYRAQEAWPRCRL